METYVKGFNVKTFFSYLNLRNCILSIRVPRGGLAQLGEHLYGIQEVVGSNPIPSTTFYFNMKRLYVPAFPLFLRFLLRAGLVACLILLAACEDNDDEDDAAAAQTPAADTNNNNTADSSPGTSSFEWIPQSESDGTLEVLLPARSDATGLILNHDESGRFVGRTSGNRPTFRFDRPGCSFGSNLTVRTNTGESFFIPNGCNRIRF